MLGNLDMLSLISKGHH